MGQRESIGVLMGPSSFKGILDGCRKSKMVFKGP